MAHRFIIGILTLVFPILAFAQAKKPTIMVIPSDAWCNENGYVQQFDNQGKLTVVPDYERAVQSDMDLVNVMTKIGELMADRGFPLKDLTSSIRSKNQDAAEDEFTMSNSGSTLAETPLEKLLNRAKADILVEVAWKINTMGPKSSVTYTLRGIDAYSNKQVAAAQGTGVQSFTVEVPVLLEEAVIEKMDNFLGQLETHFLDMAKNGREVVVNVRFFDNGSGDSFENEYGGEVLTDIIDDWMAENTVSHRYNLSDASDHIMRFEQVRMPLYRENGMPMDTRRFVRELQRTLKKAPYNIDSKIVTKGLGRADLILGEK